MTGHPAMYITGDGSPHGSRTKRSENNGCKVRLLCVRIAAMNRRTFSDDSKKKLWRPCREARALGL